MLKKYKFNIRHITASSGGATAGALPYLAARDEKDIEEFTLRMIGRQSFFSLKRGFLTPSFFNTSGGYMLEMDKTFIHDELKQFSQMETFIDNLKKIRLDISVTNITGKVENEMIHFNPIILEEDDYEKAFHFLHATICTIPLTKAPKINGTYYIDGGYSKNTPMKNLFHNPDVKSIIIIDYTNYQKYSQTIDECYRPNPFNFFENLSEMQELAMQISFDACNRTQLESALFLNNLIKDSPKQQLTIKGKSYVYKEIFSLSPVNVEMNPLHPKAETLAKEYYELGKKEAYSLLMEEEII
jgi:predicted acylesterase/phospholipase RssA